jgi:hypothetical protein
MANSPRRRRPPDGPRRTFRTGEFERWLHGLKADRKARVESVIDRIRDGGPTLGRPHVDVIHGSKMRNLKEARIDRGARALFAFDSNGNLVMLLGGDKTGKWNRWYRPNIERAERLYADHERRNGKEARWLSDRAAGRTTAQMSR